MAFSQVHATTFSEETADTTSHDVDLTGIASGDRVLLFAIIDNDGDAIVVSGMPTGWALVDEVDAGGGGGVSTEVWELLDASGSEASFQYTTNFSEKSRNRVFLISGSHSTEATDSSGFVNGGTPNPDPPSVTAGWGSDDNMFIPINVLGNNRGKTTAFPTNYDDNQHTFDSTSGDNTTVNYGVATRELAAASDDPGTFTKNSTDTTRTATFVVRPKVGTTVGIGQAVESDEARLVTRQLAAQWPAAPTGFNAVSVTSAQVFLSWTSVNDPEGRTVGYDIRRQELDGPGGSPVGNAIIIQQDWPDSDFTDIDVDQGTTYEYEVRAAIVIRPFVRQAEEVDIAIKLGSSLAVQITVATEFDVSRVLSFSQVGGGASGFGVGVPGAALAIPPGAVTATTSTLATLINNNGTNTDFALQPGTYIGTFPNKSGNGYYGNPSNHLSVTFDGQATYPNLNNGTAPDGGAALLVAVLSGNTFANFTVQQYTGVTNLGQAAPFDTAAASGVKFRNLLIQDCWRGGIRLGGTNNESRFVTSRFNGKWAVAGGGTDNSHFNCDYFSCGDNNVISRGLIPRSSGGDRGICKITFSTRHGFYNCHIHDEAGAVGLWWDINNTDGRAHDNLVEDIGAGRAIRFELSHGGTILRNTINRSENHNPAFVWKGAAILLAGGGVATIEDNVINDCESGIFILQNDRDTNATNPLTPGFWSGSCGTTIRNNLITEVHSFAVGRHGGFVKNGCDPKLAASFTIENNTESWAVGVPNQFYWAGAVTPSEWAALGYS